MGRARSIFLKAFGFWIFFLGGGFLGSREGRAST
jgi:hypothetical protein